MSADNYEERMVAFGDILGWSNSSQDLSLFSDLKEAVKSISSYAKNFSPSLKQRLGETPGASKGMLEIHAHVEFSFFSDCFAVSSPLSAFTPDLIIKIASYATHMLLNHGFLVRGGIAFGRLYHSSEVIFGPALVEAVKIEQEAKYPRFLCSTDVVNLFENISLVEKALFRDFDDEWVANIALGSWHVSDHFMRIIENSLGNLDSDASKEKWLYMQKTLPQMYEALEGKGG